MDIKFILDKDKALRVLLLIGYSHLLHEWSLKITPTVPLTNKYKVPNRECELTFPDNFRHFALIILLISKFTDFILLL